MGGTIKWGAEDWLAGLNRARSASSTTTVPQGFGTGLRETTRVNPFYRPGSLASGPTGTNLTNASVVTGLLLGVTNNSTTAYANGGDLLHRFDLTTNTITNNSPSTPTFPRQIASSTQYDTLIYNIGTTSYLFYSYGTASNGNVGRYDFSTTFNDTWLSTGSHTGAATFDTTSPHFGIVSPRTDILYFADGRALHRFDGQAGANGTLTKNAFLIPSGYVITSFSLTDNYLVVYAYKATTGGSFSAGDTVAYYWDEVSEDPTFVKKLGGVYVDGGFTLNGVAGCFVRTADPFSNATSNKNSLMLDTGGSTFEAQFYFDTNLSLPSKNGVDVIDNRIIWNSNGEIFQWGKGELGGDAIGFHYSRGGGSSSGICKNLALGALYISTGTSTSGGLQVFTGSPGAGSFSTMIVQIPAPMGMITRVKDVRIKWLNFLAVGTSCSVALNTVRTQSGTSTTVKPSSYSVTRSSDYYSPLFTSWIAPAFEAIGATVTYNDPSEIIEEIEVNFVFENYN